MHLDNYIINLFFNNQKQIKMKNSSKKTVKTVNAIVSPIEEKSSSLKKINFDKFASDLSGMQFKEKQSRDTLYIYPDTVKIAGINTDAGKSFRGKMRNKLENLCNSICSAYKSKDEEKMIIAIQKFKDNYLEFYAVNDYSYASFSRTDKNRFLIEKTIEIVKDTL